jgi:acetyl-CoA C-acetyltransferase
MLPVDAIMHVVDKQSGERSARPVRVAKDEGPRPESTAEGLAVLKAVRPDGVITAGNASQLSDGASACVLMEAKQASQAGLAPLGRYVGMSCQGGDLGRLGGRR